MAASRSSGATPSPFLSPSDDETVHPKGHCRYILLEATIKGERCGCTGFIRNRTLPGVTCDCGHLAVYHVSDPESANIPERRLETSDMDQLKRRLEVLEQERDQRLDRERDAENAMINSSLVARVEEHEQLAEATKEELGTEVMRAFGQINNLWNQLERVLVRIDRMEEVFMHFSSRFSQIDASMANMSNRQKELDDEHIDLQDRMDQIEMADKDDLDDEYVPATGELDHLTSHPRERRRRLSASDSVFSRPSPDFSRRRRSSATRSHPLGTAPPPRPVPSLSGGTAWTVHISLLPHANLAMPFEKDTNAYHRCLSRGLHQMVAVLGTCSHSFTDAVERAFGNLLQGRAWMPLQAQLCDARELQGLPMVRKLDPSLVDQPYSLEFLKNQCAVCDPSGKIDSLYIVMRDNTLSWQVIRDSPVFMHGLEACWNHDPQLDDNGLDKESAGILVAGGLGTSAAGATTPTATAPSSAVVPNTSAPTGTGGRKRNMSQISRTSSFGSGGVACEGDGARPKAARTCVRPRIGAR